MKNKDIERLIEMYAKDLITYEELMEYINRLEKKDKPDLPEPPIIY